MNSTSIIQILRLSTKKTIPTSQTKREKRCLDNILNSRVVGCKPFRITLVGQQGPSTSDVHYNSFRFTIRIAQRKLHWSGRVYLSNIVPIVRFPEHEFRETVQYQWYKTEQIRCKVYCIRFACARNGRIAIPCDACCGYNKECSIVTSIPMLVSIHTWVPRVWDT